VPETDATSSILPIHIEETIQSIAGLHAEHHANAKHHQRVVDRIYLSHSCKEDFMPERLVDVEKQGAKVLHTFPVTISHPVTEEAFKEKALEAAGYAKLVPNEELERLNAKMHVSRGGQLTPYGDPHGVLAETKAGLDQFVRERAYFLWEQAERPDGRADDFWHQAQYERFRERAYALWEREGCLEGKADEYWYRTRAFEES
jgi:hypothetical protein